MAKSIDKKVEDSEITENPETDTARLRKIINSEYSLMQCLHDMSHDLNNSLTCILGYAELANGISENTKYIAQLIKESERAAAIVCAYSLKSGSQNFKESVRHNFNNLLTSIIGFAQLWKSNPDRREKYFGIIQNEIRIAEKITTQVQTFVNSFQPRKPEPVDVYCTMENAIKKSNATNQSCEITLKPDNNARFFAKINSKELDLVYSALLQNAMEAESKKIVLDACVQNSKIFTEVKDDGIGIKQEDINQLFEPFFTRQDTVGHLGLGLATSKAIVEKYGGKILVESKIMKGSVFTVELPAYE